MKIRITITLSVLLGSVLLMGSAMYFTVKDVSLSNWHRGADGYVSAVAEQQTTGKPIALFFYTDWCTSCERLRNEVLATNEVNRFVNTLIPVQVNPELSVAARRLADDYGVFGYPTILIIPASKTEPQSIATNRGTTPASFIQSCRRALRSML
jgi:thiol:disulfide interchange protein